MSSDPFGASNNDVKHAELLLKLEAEKTARSSQRWDGQNVGTLCLTVVVVVMMVSSLLWLLFGVALHEPSPEQVYDACLSTIETDDHQTRLTRVKACERILLHQR